MTNVPMISNLNVIYANQSNSTLLTVAFNFTLSAAVRDNDTV